MIRLILALGSLLTGFLLPLRAAVDPLRLTREVEPLAQAVELEIDPARDDYAGRVRVDLIVHRPTAAFRLHALGPVLQSAALADAAGREIALTVTVTEAKMGLLTLAAAAPLPPGNYALAIAFTNAFNRQGLGLYKAVSRGDSYLFTQFEDQHARRAFPCWDEPSFKIPWQLTVTVPAELEVVANAPAAAETKRDARSKTVAFGRTPPMPSYLVALAAGPLEQIPVPGLPVPGRIVVPRGQTELAAEAARISPAILRALEHYFGIPYPYAKLDQVAVPEFVYGAMENAGMITYRDTLLLNDSRRRAFTTRRRLASVVAHEMAHMWFGDLVTMAWWDDLWLNESFATWMSEKIINQLHPEMRLNLAAVESANFALRADAEPGVLPIRRELRAGEDWPLSRALTYNKGKAILYMVEGWIGAEKFRAAMQSYMQRHRWGNTTAADLWAAFDAASGENISSLLAGFIDNPGVPLVTFSRRPDGRLQLAQQRFYTLAGAPGPGRWQVPVTFTWAAGGRVHRERVLLREAEQTLEIPGLAEAEWIYPNTAETGYYRWRLESALNARLVSRATAVLTPAERLGLISNAAATFDAGGLSGGDYLATLAGFAGDREPEVVQMVAAGLARVRSLFVAPPQLPSFLALRSALLRPALDGLGLASRAGEADYVAPLRSTLLAAFGGEGSTPEIVAFARERTAEFLRDPERPATPAVLGIAAYHGDAALLDALVALLPTAKTPAARAAVIGALGAFNDPGLAARALELALTPALNSTEFLRIPYSLGSRPGLRPAVVDWFMANYDAIKAKGPPQQVSDAIALAGTEAAVFARLRDFLLDPVRRTDLAQARIRIAADQLALAEELRKKETAGVRAYLATYPAAPDRDRPPAGDHGEVRR